MAKMKTEFPAQIKRGMIEKAEFKIVPGGGAIKPYVSVNGYSIYGRTTLVLELEGQQQLETFAVNILKAIGSKKLKK